MSEIFAIVDLETTGPKFDEGDRIIQFGCTLVKHEKIIEHYCIDIHPGRDIPKPIQELTGITMEQIQSAPYFDEVACMIFSLLENHTFVAHNVGFDYSFLVKSFQQLAGIEFSAKCIDTVQLAQVLLPTTASYRLSDLAHELQLSHSHAHTAGSDAYATAEMFIYFMKKIKRLPKQVLKKCLPYSKHLVAETGWLFDWGYKNNRPPSIEKFEESFVEIEDLVIKRPNHTPLQRDFYNAFDLSTVYEKLILKKIRIHRPLQLEFIQLLTNQLSNSHSIACTQAPFGIGKSYGYLLNAFDQISKGKKVWISVPTILLQQQLIEQELLPLLQDAELSYSWISLKGKQHYLSLSAFHHSLPSIDEVSQLTQRHAISIIAIFIWLLETDDGDLTQLNPFITNQDWFLNEATFSLDSRWKKVDFYERKLNQIETSDLIIVNHACLWSILLHQEWTSYEGILLIDEVHQFERFAFQHEELTSYFEQFIEIKEQLVSVHLQDVVEKKIEVEAWRYELTEFLHHIEMEMESIAESLQKRRNHSEKKYCIFTLDNFENSFLYTHLHNIKVFLQYSLHSLPRFIKELPAYLSEPLLKFVRCSQKIQKALQQLEQLGTFDRLICAKTDEDSSLMIEKFTFPIEHQALLESKFSKIIGFSATLFQHSILFGDYLKEHRTSSVIKAPYFEHQPLYLLDKPEIFYQNHLEMDAPLISQYIARIFSLKRKKILVLVHSKEALNQIYDSLKTYQIEHKYSLLAQGISGSLRKIKQQFLHRDSVILLGLSSFWEGFDLPEKELQAVVITKLPFANPNANDQLVLHDYFSSKKHSYFYHYALPQMFIQLKQGIGRLRSTLNTTQSVWILDNRLANKSYGKRLIKELEVQYPVFIGDFENCLHDYHRRLKN